MGFRPSLNGKRFALWILVAVEGGCGDVRTPTPEEELAKADRIVLKIVAEQFLRDPELQLPASLRSKSKLVVWKETEGLSAFITTGQLSFELKDQPPVSVELYNNLKFRNGRMITLDAIESTSVVMGSSEGMPKETFAFDAAFEK